MGERAAGSCSRGEVEGAKWAHTGIKSKATIFIWVIVRRVVLQVRGAIYRKTEVSVVFKVSGRPRSYKR